MLRSSLDFGWEELKKMGFYRPEFKWKKYEKNGFDTPTGKIELFCTRLKDAGYDPLPYFEEPPESPYSVPKVAEEFPYILITGARIPTFFQSEFRQLPKLRKGRREPECELHPETAKALGVKEGDWVSVETMRGKCRQKVKLFSGIDPRVVHAQHGWWFPEDNTTDDHGIWDSNANTLTNIEAPYCSAMGTYQLRALLCKVVKVELSEKPWTPKRNFAYQTNVNNVQEWT